MPFLGVIISGSDFQMLDFSLAIFFSHSENCVAYKIFEYQNFKNKKRQSEEVDSG